MSLHAGKLRHRINIEQAVRTQDPESGEEIVSWVLLHELVAAAIEPLSAREFMASSSVQSQIVARITIRYIEGLTSAMRIIHNGKIYNPAGWLHDLDSGVEYLTAPVSEGVNNG